MILEECNEEVVLKVTQDQRQELADFYRAVEQWAFRMAVIETCNSSDAMKSLTNLFDEDANIELHEEYDFYVWLSEQEIKG